MQREPVNGFSDTIGSGNMVAIYIICGIAMSIGLLALYAPDIEKWCDKQLGNQD
jgi:hypothetical protein